MDSYRTSNLGYIRQSQAARADEYVPNLTEERIEHERRQVFLTRFMIVLAIVVVLMVAPVFFNIFHFGGVTSNCSEQSGFMAKMLAPVRRIFGGSTGSKCEKIVSQDIKTDSEFKTETITKTTTCSRGEEPDAAAAETKSSAKETLTEYYQPENFKGEQEAKGGSFWSWFSGPAKGTSECGEHLKSVEKKEPSVVFFKKLMPSIQEVLKNGAKYASLVGGASALQQVSDEDVNSVHSLFNMILDPSRVWHGAENSALGAVSRKSKESLANIANLFPIHSTATNLKLSGANLLKKKDYVKGLKIRLEGIPNNSRECVDRIAGIDAQINGLSLKNTDLLSEKNSLEDQIKENQLKLNAFVNQRNVKEQEPINTVRKFDLELQELKFKLSTIPGIRAEIDTRQKAIAKAESDILNLRLKLDKDEQSTSDLQSKIYSAQSEIDMLRRDMEKFRIQLGLRRMKLELANSNRQIKEHLMSLIRTNNGEAVDFQELFSSSENARREIKRILRDFINQSAGMSYEINVSEAQIDEIIAKDEKEFDEIRKIYIELVEIIKRYGDFNIYISGIAKDIKDYENKLREDDAKLNDLLHKIKDWKPIVDGTEARRSAWENDISRLQNLIAEGRRIIDEKQSDMRKWQEDYDDIKSQKEIFMNEHKVC